MKHRVGVRWIMRGSVAVAALLAGAVASAQSTAPVAASATTEPAAPQADPAATGQDIVVTGSRIDLVGVAMTASQGTVTGKEIELRPVFRVGQLFESIPGLVVTIHSGEGKANQYLIRGFNLDHGTDFANFVDDMPVNRPTNTHGQGYSDLAFLMPPIVGGIDYTKGPYYAGIGDFGSVASSHVRLADTIPNQVSTSVGTLGDQDLFAGGTVHLGDDRRLLFATDLSHYDGPWHPVQDFRKINAVLRYSDGDAHDGVSLTGMFYKSAGLLTTDQPLRAVTQGLIGRYGTLDPTDASRSLRYSLSAHLAKPVGGGELSVSLYGIHSTMTLWNDFTHYLDDPVNGDQEEQDERRNTIGGAASYTIPARIGSIDSETVVGLQARYDSAFVDRRHTVGRTTILDYCTLEQEDGPTLAYAAVGGFCTADRVHLLDLGPYAQNTTHWTRWLRTVIGVREEYYHADDTSSVTGTSGAGHQWLFQPKGSLILGPWAKTEFYLSYGRGFHSNDVRGVFGTVPEEGIPLASGPTPLLSATTGMEIGVRSDIVPRLMLQFAVFQQDFGSELVYNADSGQDEAGAPSRRQGVEVSAQYRPFPWIELNTDLAFSHARYRTGDLARFGLDGPYIADAPGFIGSFGILIDRLGPWFGGLQWRKLGPYPINDGTRTPEDKGYSEFNLDIGYTLDASLKLRISVYNALNSHADAAAYYYTSRLPGEPAEGIADYQVHPLEPRSARFSVTKTF